MYETKLSRVQVFSPIVLGDRATILIETDKECHLDVIGYNSSSVLL